MLTDEYVKRVYAQVEQRDGDQPEFLQAVREVFETIQPVVEKHPEYEKAGVLERIVEPERVVKFRVAWTDDEGKVQVNRGYRVQFNSAIGPYKGGLRFHPTVNEGVERNGSSMIAFHLPKKDFQGFHIVASHSDSPTYRIKEQPEMSVEKHYTKLNIERYGGMIPETWFDRPLSVAGRIIIEENGQIKDQLVNVDRDLMIIPNLAIHMSRSSNESKQLNPQKDLLPLCGGNLTKDGFEEMIAKESGVEKEDILSYDLFLYNRMRGTTLGINEEFVAAPKLDDLECAYSSIEGMLNAKLSKDYVTVCAVFDNEEVGSGTKQGAGSTFFPEVLKRISYLCGKNEEEYYMAVADSFMLSADNAHAVHPNYQDKTDPTNRPYINEGIVLKYNASQKYTTDANSAALVKYLCKKEKIKCQVFFNRSDMLGGSTLGNILTGQVSIKAADIGLPQLSMHSTYETAGCKDLDDMITLMGSFYELGKEVQI